MKKSGNAASSREVLQALLVAAITGLIGEIAFSLALAGGVHPPFGYLVLCSGLTLLAALLCGGVLSATIPRIPVALSAWAGLNTVLCLRGIAGNIAFVAVGTSLLTALLLEMQREIRIGASISVGMALVFLAVIWPRTFTLLGMARPTGIYRPLSIIGSFGGVLLLFWLYGEARKKLRWIPSEVLFCGSLLVLVVGGSYFAKQSSRVQLTEYSESHCATAPSQTRELPSVLLLILDTVRADHLSVYGYERDTTPALRTFADNFERTRVFPLALSPATWTLPAHASLFTGEMPSNHGAHLDYTGSKLHSVRNTDFRADRTLAETMKAAGYQTAAIFANTLLSMYPGLERGFDLFEKPEEAKKLYLTGESLRALLFPSWFAADLKPYPSASQINSRILEFLDAASEKPCFVVANYMEAHAPWAPRKPYSGAFSDGGKHRPAIDLTINDSEERLRNAVNRYDEEVLALDSDLEQLFLELQSRGQFENSWIIITSDHGEAFGEHGVVKHLSSVYNEEVRIPLIVRPPQGEAVPSTSDAVSLIDVATTLAAVAGEASFGIGNDLRTLPTEPAPVQIEFFGTDDKKAAKLGFLAAVPARAVVLGHAKLIEYPDSCELFKLDEDPKETRNFDQTAPDQVAKLASLLPPLTREQPLEVENKDLLSPEQIERLRALGYIE